MNERLMEFLLRDEVTRLSGVKKQVYEFIVNEEDYLASKADTVDQFEIACQAFTAKARCPSFQYALRGNHSFHE
ncbi:hypothetical protein [Peribacillus frigoritolerans]|uniref:hypothetical protein n=1 Tax=Peribacillus frigoritolerans TaxID=450367 RepID=UPI0032E4DFC8